jgi:hypothetical protein
VRRLSVASRESGAKSPVYGKESAARPEVARSLGDSGPAGPGRQVTRDTPAVDRIRSAQVGMGAPRRAATSGSTVVYRPSGRWYVKGHPCIYAADGYPMTSFASSRAVPRGPRSPGKLTDVNGREG